MTGTTMASRLLATILLATLPTLAGTVITQSDRTPVAGATVHLADIDTGEIFSSTTTTADGHFVFTDFPEATYRVAVAVDEGKRLALDGGGGLTVADEQDLARTGRWGKSGLTELALLGHASEATGRPGGVPKRALGSVAIGRWRSSGGDQAEACTSSHAP